MRCLSCRGGPKPLGTTARPHMVANPNVSPNRCIPCPAQAIGETRASIEIGACCTYAPFYRTLRARAFFAECGDFSLTSGPR